MNYLPQQPQPQLHEFYPDAPNPGQPSISPYGNNSLDIAQTITGRSGNYIINNKFNPLSQYTRSPTRLQQNYNYIPLQNIDKNPNLGIPGSLLVSRSMSQKRQRGLQNRFTARMKNRLAARIARSRSASRGTTFYGGQQMQQQMQQTRSKQMLHNLSQRLSNAFGLRRQQMGGNKRSVKRSEKKRKAKRKAKRSEAKRRSEKRKRKN
jgi:hypothetical protein